MTLLKIAAMPDDFPELSHLSFFSKKCLFWGKIQIRMRARMGIEINIDININIESHRQNRKPQRL